MKKKLIIFSLLLLITGCNNNSNTNQVNDNSEFYQNIEELVKIVDSIDTTDYENEYNKYYINDSNIYGLNYNTKELKYELNLNKDLSYLNLSDGVLVKNKQGDIFLSINNDKYCAVKDFSSSKILVYSFDDVNCHRTYADSELINVSVSGIQMSNDKVYKAGYVSNDYIYLKVICNIFDKKSYTYTWYRNNEIIENSNINEYTITANNEDAEYVVEITTIDGQSIKSEPFHVIINK